MTIVGPDGTKVSGGGQTQRLELVEWRNDPPVQVEATDSITTLAFGPAPNDTVWLVERLTIARDGDGDHDTECRLFIGEAVARNFVDGTPAGNLDVAEFPHPLLIPSNSQLLAVWSNTVPEDVCTLRVQYRIMRKGK